MRHNPLYLFSFALLATAAAGCFEVQSTLNADGSGTVEVTYTHDKKSNLRMESARLESKQLEVTEAKSLDNDRVKLKGKFKDIRKLSTSNLFRGFKITLEDKDGQSHLTLTRPAIRKVQPTKKGEEKKPSAAEALELPDGEFWLHLPGKIVDSNGKSTDDDTVRWLIDMDDFYHTALEFKVTYKVAESK